MSDGPAIPPRMSGRSAMPTQGFLDRAGAVNIDEHMAHLERAHHELAGELQRQREQIVKTAARLLEPELRPLLEWLLDITLRRPMLLPNMGPESVTFCALREGQNQVAWQILQAIAQGREEAAPMREGL